MGSRLFAWLRALALVGVVLLMAATSAGALQGIGASLTAQASSINYGARLKQALSVDVAAADNGELRANAWVVRRLASVRFVIGRFAQPRRASSGGRS